MKIKMDLINRYEVLKKKVIERKETFDRLIAMLEGETTWLTSPASTRYHLSEEQGLLKHSVGVAETLLRFWETFAPATTEESCVIVGLLHDVGKLGMPGKPLYLRDENKWMAKTRGIRYKINKDVVAMGLAVRSLYLVSRIHSRLRLLCQNPFRNGARWKQTIKQLLRPLTGFLPPIQNWKHFPRGCQNSMCFEL